MRVAGRSVALSLALTFSAWSLAQPYTIRDITIGSPFPDALAYGVSPSGLVTGVGTDILTGELHAFIDNNGVFQDLGDLGYPYGADGLRINDNGQVSATGYGPGYNALRYWNGTVKKLGSIDGGSSEGLGINSSGDIVGRAINGDMGSQGFTYIGGHFSALAVTIARGINDSDDYVGSLDYSWIQNGYVHVVEHGFLCAGGTTVDLGSIGGGVRSNTEAFGVNGFRQVTGYSTTATGAIHAFLYDSGVMTDLGTIPPYDTYGVSINDQGQVLGNIETYVGGQVGVFLYSNGRLKNLSDLLGWAGSGWSQLTACQINNKGWIVGYGTIHGATHGFLAKPVFPISIGPHGQ